MAILFKNLPLVVICLVGCSPSASVSTKLEKVVANSGNDEVVRIGELTDFEWEFFIAMGPYTNQEAAEAAIGFAWPGFERFDLASSESFSLIVFVNNGSVVRAEKHPRCQPDFSREVLLRPLSPKAAVFSINRDDYCPQATAAAEQMAPVDPP